jgi:bloom syndrome protein
MALTATANESCKRDIVELLSIEGCEMLTSSFNRSNLHYRVILGKTAIIQNVSNFIKSNHPESTGVIYCTTKKGCEDTAKALREQHGLRAWFYHAGMPTEERRAVQEKWYRDELLIIVATVN